MNAELIQPTDSTSGSKQAYESPRAVFATTKFDSGRTTSGNYPSSNNPCGDCDPPSNYPSANNPCGDC